MSEPLAIREPSPELVREITDAKIDAFEIAMLRDLTPIDCPLDHKFTPGLYTRTIFMPKGSLVSSKIHRTEHPYIVSKGMVVVFIEDENGQRMETIRAPHVGVTMPWTRRVLFMVEDTIWTTVHAITDDEQGDLEKIEARIIERRELPWGKTAYEEYRAALDAAITKALADGEEGEAR